MKRLQGSAQAKPLAGDRFWVVSRMSAVPMPRQEADSPFPIHFRSFPGPPVGNQSCNRLGAHAAVILFSAFSSFLSISSSTNSSTAAEARLRDVSNRLSPNS